MEPTITADIVVAYAQCPRKAYLLLFNPDKGEPLEYVQILEQQRREHQEKYINRLQQIHADVQPYSVENLRKGSQVLINMHLQVDGLAADCGVLTRVEGTSMFGKYSYEPAIFVGTHSISKEYKLALSFVGHVLERLQSTLPVAGRIIGMDGKSHTAKLGESSKDLRPLLEPLQEWTTAPSPKPPPVMLNHHCPTCQFQRMCRAQAIQEDHLSLLGGITPQEIRQFHSKGLFTINQLSYTFRPRRIRNRPSNYIRPHSFALQALALRNRKIYVHETPIVPHAPVDIYLDIEGLPDRNLHYLLGLVIYDKGEVSHHYFWANNKDEEAAIFQQLLVLLRQYPAFTLFHYGSYEAKYLQKMRPSLDDKSKQYLEKVIQNSCNLLSFFYSHIYLPTYTNGLKEIAHFLGFEWTADNASGLQSIVWRHLWEDTHDESIKDRIIVYNKEDCLALIKVKDLIYTIVENETTNLGNGYDTVYPKHLKRNILFSFQEKNYALPEMEDIHKYSHFDYQRERVHVRTTGHQKQGPSRQQAHATEKLPIDTTRTIDAHTCPVCGTARIEKLPQTFSKPIVDLEFFDVGVKRSVVRYRTHKSLCHACHAIFIPPEYVQLRKFFGHALKCWVIFQHIVHTQSFRKIQANLKEVFQVDIPTSVAHDFKRYISEYHKTTSDKLLQKILPSTVMYVDETPFQMRHETVYAWIFTNGEEVVSMYRETREGDFLKELLKDFKGVLVSDFFPIYYSMECPQQKCLIHLLRDVNDDLLKNPFDEEFKGMTRHFTRLLQTIIHTVDQFGLQRRHLRKHHRAVDTFFAEVSATVYTSEVSKQYQVRFEKNRHTLFTFLDYDNVSWNNTYAEHAVKLLATHRNKNIEFFRASRMDEYLRIMSIYQTCQYKEVSFLKFLLSKETDMDEYCRKIRN
jgi:predicted RecB family nuclease